MILILKSKSCPSLPSMPYMERLTKIAISMKKGSFPKNYEKENSGSEGLKKTLPL